VPLPPPRATQAVGLAVEEDGIHHLLAEISIATAQKSPPHVRVAAAALVTALSKECAFDLSASHPAFMQCIVHIFHAEEPAVLRAGVSSLDGVVKSVSKERYPLHVSWLKQHVADVSTEYRVQRLAAGASRDEVFNLPAFSIASGVGSLVAVCLQVRVYV
jgi:hypothetical protein